MTRPRGNDPATREADERDAEAAHQADRPPTSSEELSADRAAEDPELSGDHAEVGRNYEKMAERGAKSRGEGRIA